MTLMVTLKLKDLFQVSAQLCMLYLCQHHVFVECLVSASCWYIISSAD